MIHKITKWQNASQTIYCLSDFHIATQPHNVINNQQRNAIVQAAKSHDAHVIAEDSLRHFDLEPSNEQIYAVPRLRLMQLNPNQASILGLSSLCYYAGISTDNVEFRLGATAAHIPGHATSKVLAHVQEAIERIKKYNDGPIANAWYKKILEEYSQLSNGPALNFLQELYIKGDQHISRALLESIPYTPDIQEALEHLNSDFDWNKMDQYTQKVVFLMIFDNKLIDAELVHALMQHPDKKAIFVCSGSQHINQISPILEELGFKKMASEGDDLIAQDIRYQEPHALPANQLSSLLEAKETRLPLLLKINLYIQSLLDSNNAHRWIGFVLNSICNLIAIISILLLSSLLGINSALWLKIFVGILLGNTTFWYLGQPTKK